MTDMDDTQKMLRMIINGQSAFRQEVLKRINDLDKKLSNKIDENDQRLSGRVDNLEENLTRRIDAIGKSLAYLEADTPTREEFENLEKTVNKLTQKTTSA